MNRWITSCLLIACLLGIAVVPPARGARMAPLVLGLSSYVDPVNQPFIDSLRADLQYEWALAVEVHERALEADAVSIALPEQTLVIRRSPVTKRDQKGLWYGLVEHTVEAEARRSWFTQPGVPSVPVFRQRPDGRVDNVMPTPGVGQASGYIYVGKDTYGLIAMRAGGYVLTKKNTAWIPPAMEDARPLFIGTEAALR